jgi:hypothetical protein
MALPQTQGNRYRSGGGVDMGLGALSSPNLAFKRKYRWSFLIQPHCGGIEIPEHFVKIAARPNISIEETEINFLNGKMWIPGKASWETLTVTYYDVGGADSGIGTLFQWLATTFNFLDPVGLHQSSFQGSPNSQGYAARAELKLYDGCGDTMETWIMDHMWPQAINFGELDYSSSEEVTIELTLRFSTCQYIPGCGVQIIPPCCGGCES